MNTFSGDLRLALRRARTKPGHTISAVLIVALGLGINTSLFSLANRILSVPTGVQHLNRLAFLTSTRGPYAAPAIEFPDKDLPEILQKSDDLIEGVITSDVFRGVLSNGNQSVVLVGEHVSGDYFEALGVVPVVGRLIDNRDSGTHEAVFPVVISHRLAVSLFKGPQSAVNQSVTVAGYPAVVVGVAPDAFPGTWLPTLIRTDLWAPASAEAYSNGDRAVQSNAVHRTFLRMNSGVSLAQVKDFVDARSRLIIHRDPEEHFVALAAVDGIFFAEFKRYGRLIAAAAVAASALLLLVGVFNIASLTLANASSRQGEAALRMAAGASSGALLRLCLIEAVVPTSIGGIGGFCLMYVATRLINASSLPVIQGIGVKLDATPNSNVFLYGFLLLFAIAALIGLAAGLIVANASPATLLSRRPNTMSRSAVAQPHLLAVQVAASVILMTTAWLLVHSALRLARIGVSYSDGRIAVAQIDLSLQPKRAISGPELVRGLLSETMELTNGRAALASELPGSWDKNISKIAALDGSTRWLGVQQVFASPGLLSVIGLSIREGRDFGDQDTERSAIISERAAKALFSNESAVGRSIRVGAASNLVVVGIVDEASAFPERATPPCLYRLLDPEEIGPRFSLVVSTRGASPQSFGLIRTAIQRVDPTLPVLATSNVSDATDPFAPPLRAAAAVFAGLAFGSVLIAMAGVYGHVSSLIDERKLEFGIRKALGADNYRLSKHVMIKALRPVLVGILPGACLAYLAESLLSHVYFGVTSSGMDGTLRCSAGLIASAILAAAVPTVRLMRVDPASVLRTQ